MQSNYDLLDRFTEREIEVLQSLIDCMGDAKVITDRLFIANTTLKTHLKQVFRKLGVRNKTAAVIEGLRQGLVKITVH